MNDLKQLEEHFNNDDDELSVDDNDDESSVDVDGWGSELLYADDAAAVERLKIVEEWILPFEFFIA